MRYIYIFGDSNAIVFKNLDKLYNSWIPHKMNEHFNDISNLSKPGQLDKLEFVHKSGQIQINIFVFNGSSAKGLVKNESITNHKQTIRNELQKHTNEEIVSCFFCFGLVDLDFVYWLKLIKGYIDFDTYIESCVNDYCQGIKDLINSKKVYIFDTTPPTVSNENILEFFKIHINDLYTQLKTTSYDVAIEKMPYIDYKNRWKFHEKFNSLLNSKAKEERFTFFDSWDKYTSNGELKDEFMNKVLKLDHHLDLNKLSEIWCKTINDTFIEKISTLSL